MMNDKVVGLILKQSDYKNSDGIITVLTREYGKLSLVAKGIRKISSKNAGRLLPYCKAEFLFDYRDDKTMFTMKNVSLIEMNRTLHEDLQLQTCASVLCEITDEILLNGYEGENYQKIYDDLDKCFSYLNQNKDTNTIMTLFIADIMHLFGILPQVDGCAVCGSQLVQAISIDDGGFLCADCRKKAGIESFETGDLKRFRLLVKGGLKHFDLIEQTGGATKQDTRICIQMLRKYAGIPIRSFQLYERLFCH